MPRGPLGVPRPGATCNLAIKAQFNKPDGFDASSDNVVGLLTHRIASKAKDITVTEETEMGFPIITVDMTLGNELLLAEIEDLVSDIEDGLGKERVSVTIESV